MSTTNSTISDENLKNNNTEQYDASQITVLEGLEAVRKRPGMYIGNTGKDGLHRCLGEILDNSVDEAMAGYASAVKVVIDNKTKTALVADDGRGIPVGIHPKTGKSAIETIMTVLHAGGKFEQNNYQFAGGLHGVGASVVNALSNNMEVWVYKDDVIYYIAFAKGKTVASIISMSLEEFNTRFPFAAAHTLWDEKKSGTITLFNPDDTIFETTDFDTKEIANSLKHTAYLNPGLRLIFEYDGAKQSKSTILFDQLNQVSDQELLDYFA
jgi:DNA gyrase subunit B